MTISKKVTSINYTLDLSVKESSTIMDKDLLDDGDPLHIQLACIEGVFDIDYDGHFGPHIFLTVAHEHDNIETWNTIYKTIKDYL